MKRFLAFLVAANMIFFVVAASAQRKPPLQLLQTIPLPDLKGGDFERFDVDLATNRIFLAAEDNDTVVVFDIRTNKLIHTIRGFDTPHTLLYLSAIKQLWVLSRGDGTIKVLDGSTYSVMETVKLAIGADSAVYDPPRHLLYIVTGGEDAKMGFSLISIVDTNTRKRVGDITLESTNIEAMAIDKTGARLFANVRDRSLVNGREALDALEKGAYDLALMDLQMPEMDGFQATADIRERERDNGNHLHVIALTAHAMKGDRERCLAAGMDGYLAKPIRPRELDELLESCLLRRTGAAQAPEIPEQTK